MKAKTRLSGICALVLAVALFPGIAFCELEGLNDDELSKVEAKAMGPVDDETISSAGEVQVSLDCAADGSPSCNLSPEKTCSNFFNDINPEFNPLNPNNNIQFNQTYRVPACRSGGCGGNR